MIDEKTEAVFKITLKEFVKSPYAVAMLFMILGLGILISNLINLPEKYTENCNKQIEVLVKKNDEKEKEFKNYLLNTNAMLDKELRKKDTIK